MADPQEPVPQTSLCLGIAADDLVRLRRHPLITTLLKGRATTVRREIALVDTAPAEDGSRALIQAGWLCLNEGTEPHLLPWRANAAPLPDIAALGALEILAQGRVERITLPLAEGRLLLERLDLARGRQRQAIAVLRFEDMPAAQAAELALSLCRDFKPRLLGASAVVPLASGLGLIAPVPARAGEIPPMLPQTDSAIAAACAILRHCLAQFEANIQAVLLGRDSEGVHQMRVALRRLRSALDIFSPILPPSWLETLIADLRWLNTPLGKRRDLDVFVEETLQPLRAAEPAIKGLEHLQTLLDARRQAAQEALLSALASPRATQWLLRLQRLAAASEAEALALLDPAQHEAALQPAIAFAAATLRQRRRKLKKLGERHGELSVPELHRLRIRAKKLRYATEFFRYLFAKKPVKFSAMALARLQDTLGALNDAAVGDELLGGILGAAGEDAAAAAIAGWFAARQSMQLSQLGPAWKAYIALKPYWRDALPQA